MNNSSGDLADPVGNLVASVYTAAKDRALAAANRITSGAASWYRSAFSKFETKPAATPLPKIAVANPTTALVLYGETKKQQAMLALPDAKGNKMPSAEKFRPIQSAESPRKSWAMPRLGEMSEAELKLWYGEAYADRFEHGQESMLPQKRQYYLYNDPLHSPGIPLGSEENPIDLSNDQHEEGESHERSFMMSSVSKDMSVDGGEEWEPYIRLS